jgi:S-adenosylhomocysteine hydrolase
MVLTLTGSEPALAKIASLVEQKLSIQHQNNLQMVAKTLLAEKTDPLQEYQFEADETIVDNGALTLKGINHHYAKVPLGLIVAGAVVVIKEGKATKLLTSGDFIGLFETSDWICQQKSRHLGNWTLVSESNTRVIFFDETIICNSTFKDYLLELSIQDPVPQPHSNMPLLDWVAAHTTHASFDECAIIAHTHLLPSNMPLFRHLAHLVGPGRMFVMEKPYSTTPSVLQDLVKSGCEVIPVKVESGTPYSFSVQKSAQVLWDSVVEEHKRGLFSKLLILDDGGDLWLSVPYDRLQGVPIAGVEQTQRGTTRIESSRHMTSPIVSVASSGVKKIVESDFIGRSVVLRLKEAGHITKHARVGVIGAGSIGNSVAETSLALGCVTSIYDPIKKLSHAGLITAPSLDELIVNSDIIIGTTGTNALRGVAFSRINGRKKLASASSADIEFSSLLRIAKTSADPFDSVMVEVQDGLEFEILNGGFPFNFDRQGNVVHEEDIVLTRALLYAGMMQARDTLDTHVPGGLYDMDIETQRHLLTAWLKQKAKNNEVVKEEFRDIESVINSTFLSASNKTASVWK